LVAGKPYGFITFIEEDAAAAFLQQATSDPPTIMGQAIQIGVGAARNLPQDVATAVASGATRNIYVGNIDESVTDDFLRHVFSRFGPIDCVDVIAAKRIAFVHFCSLQDALKCKEALNNDPQWSRFRTNFGPDRCAAGSKHKKYADRASRSAATGMGASVRGWSGTAGQAGGYSQPKFGGQAYPATAGFEMAPSNGIRTVWLGGITEDMSAHDICNVVRGGLVDEVRMLREKKCAFVSFVKAQDAAYFQQTHSSGLSVNGISLKVGWGKPKNLFSEVASAVAQGATRNVFIGGIDETVTETRLLADLSGFGEIEKCNVLPEKKIAFINFTSISAAVACANDLKNPESQLQASYGTFKVNFGKDRCAQRSEQQSRGFNKGSANMNFTKPAATFTSYAQTPQTGVAQAVASNPYADMYTNPTAYAQGSAYTSGQQTAYTGGSAYASGQQTAYPGGSAYTSGQSQPPAPGYYY